MSIDNLGDLRHVVDRMGLPPRAKLLIDQLEKQAPIDKLPKSGEAEVRQILGYVAGPTLLAAIVAHLLGAIPDDQLPQPEPEPEPEPEDDDDEGEGDEPESPATGEDEGTPPPPPAPPREPDQTTT